MDILFRTVHGSHLYGLAHPGSDLDYYTVIPSRPGAKTRYAKHKITSDLDSMVLDFSTFRVYCDKGVPQCLEALFSPVAEIDFIKDFRSSYRVDTAATVGRYRRTIKSFGYTESLKSRRHALRLCLNLKEMLETGRFNPTLDPLTAAVLTDYAVADDYYETLERMAP